MNPAPVVAALNKNDPETLKLAGPVQIEQGKADTTVIPLFTDQLDTELKPDGAKLTYKTYAGVDHAGRGAQGRARQGRDRVREASSLG